MSNRFLSKGFAKNSDDDDFVKKQLSALGDTTDSDANDNVDVDVDVSTQEQAYKAVELVPGPAASVAEKSVLQQGFVVNGSITSTTALLVYGEVVGDIVCENDVTVDGKVDGNVKAENIQVLSGHIKGDIDCKSAVTVLKDAMIKGNISGESLSCDGEINGNTTVTGKAAIKENAIIKGDISCEKISICEGAVCKGIIETNVSAAQSASKPVTSAKAEIKANDSEDVQIGIVTDLKRYI